ncbi:dihydrofolate reductase family protein [Sciscionella marina]|uniref:dihydrofolate reductase family protein n=1 Tax=Sciscionella marina TaxID=508770 RepID=UPI000362850D|nr:dihydrofolate reductase family protein [Sciscionella marina]
MDVWQIWPEQAQLDEQALERRYSYPDRWLVVNFVSSADGAVESGGHSAPLSTPPDRVVYHLGSDLADVVLLGAGTAVGEGFHGVRPDELTARRRAEYGLAPVAPIAVVSTGPTLPPDAPVLTDVLVPSIVLTCGDAPVEQRRAWAGTGSEVIVAGRDRVDLGVARAALEERGLHRIDCEGGPTLFGSLLAKGLVDELRLTLAPMLLSGPAGRIAAGAPVDARLRLDSVLTQADTLLMRYLVER